MQIVAWYNSGRLHAAFGYLRPIDYHRGAPATLHEARRHRRREQNLKLQRPMLPLETREGRC